MRRLRNKRNPAIIISIALLFLLQGFMSAQRSSVVQVHADKSSGYGVAWGGPQNSPDLIVTALHIVSGKKTIVVVWQGKTTYARVEKIYKPSDLALLRLQTSMGIPPLSLYSGNAPFDTDVNFWEVPVNTSSVASKNTVLDETTSLAKISPRVANNPAGLSKALCADGGQYYPGMNTLVINFKEPNIRKAHSGSPLTYGDKIIGMVDGGAKLVDGKACVWAIPAGDFMKLYNQGTPIPASMYACDQPGNENKYMYSGMRSDNPLLSQEEVDQARNFESTLNFSAANGSQMSLYHDYRMSFEEVYSTLFEDEQQDLNDMLESEEDLPLSELLNTEVDIYVEENTGITMMVPSHCVLQTTQNEMGTLVTATSPGGLLTMSFYISPNSTMEAGLNAMSQFKYAMGQHGYSLNTKSEDIDDFRDDEYNPYYGEYASSLILDDEGQPRSELISDMMVNAGDFFAVSVYVADWSQFDDNHDELVNLYLMETCAMLSDFSVY